MLAKRCPAFKNAYASGPCCRLTNRGRIVRNHSSPTSASSSPRDHVQKKIPALAKPMLNQLSVAAATVAASVVPLVLLHASGAAEAAASYVPVTDLAEIDAGMAKLAQSILR